LVVSSSIKSSFIIQVTDISNLNGNVIKVGDTLKGYTLMNGTTA
jgi:hypothetical protein